MDNPPVLSESSEPCLNCGKPLMGDYCGNCGQEAKDFRRPFFRLSGEAIQSLFELDGRAFRTLFFLLTKPAHLSKEYFSGRRMQYTPPLRLFLVISVSFFLLVSLYTSIRSIEEALNPNISGSEAAASISDDVSLTIGNDTDEDGDNGLAQILSFVESINLPFLDDQTNANLRRVMSAQAEANLNTLVEDPVEFSRGYLEYITFFMLLMIPLLALIQKLIYIRTGHYYVEHLVLTLHNHAFVIFVVFVTSLTDMVEESQIPIINSVFGYLGAAIYIWMWVYLFLSLKNYFQQGYGITLLKYVTTTILYGFTLSFGILLFSGILFFLF
ncbi:MAG: hypothetical protein COB20_15730 [SAR86 cluster bacterium]|uniref:DUF3667 domain-containing protein n=1 Tax=SAR86 cluster bacterium TaxID=2030880 RepID=A0A2A4WTZ0_9GAMM|nr:MAG: hypothetical protein COB20_15730 [SAR86 cluster bacterium]